MDKGTTAKSVRHLAAAPESQTSKEAQMFSSIVRLLLDDCFREFSCCAHTGLDAAEFDGILMYTLSLALQSGLLAVFCYTPSQSRSDGG